MEKKEPVSLTAFEESIKMSSPMLLSSGKSSHEKSAYDYFLQIGDSLAQSISSGKSPLFPNQEGFIDLQPAYNINNNTKSEGLTQIMLLTKALELGTSSNGFVTFETVKKAQDAGVECKILKGAKAVVIPVVDEKNWSEIKFKNTWFNILQIENAENLVSWCKDKMTEQYKKDVQYINEHYPNSEFKEKKNPAERIMSKPNEKIMPLNEKTEEPFQYIAQVLNAVNSGRKLYVTPEQAENFKNKTIAILNSEYQPGKRDVFAVKKLMNSAEFLYQKNKKLLKEYSQKKEEHSQKTTLEKKMQKKERSFERSM